MKHIAKRSMKTQHGGTVIGFIFGLVIGLGIAVVVALMITKTSSPFTNKLGMTKAADTPVVQLTDPNKPLYGNAFKETLANRPAGDNSYANDNASDRPDSADQGSQPDSPLETAKLTPKPDAKVDKPDQKVDPKTAKPGETTQAKNSADEKASYYLQVGAFHDASDAENARAKLALIGVESSVSEKSSEGDSLFRVRIGPFDKVENMNRVRSKLSESSIDVAVIKTPK